MAEPLLTRVQRIAEDADQLATELRGELTAVSNETWATLNHLADELALLERDLRSDAPSQ